MLENKIISAALSGGNFFILGQAGTVKSTVIKEIYHMLTSLGKVVKTNYMVKCVLENKIILTALSGHNFFVLGQAGTG